ncbi:MAG TPA: nuclear transport factor 2 family protein [Acidimicrobiia bacterium]
MTDAALDPVAIAETMDYVAIRRLQDAYADVVTRRAWQELGELFVPECVVELDTRQGDLFRFDGPHELGAFIAGAIEQFDFFEFVTLNTRIETGAGGNDDATARLYMCELRTERETRRWNNAFGVYHDRYRRHDGRWRFAHRRYHSLARPSADGATVDAFDFPHHLELGDL